MAEPLHVSDVRFVRAGYADRERGLLGWLRLTVGKLRLDGVTLRRTSDGRHVLSYPGRRDGQGRRHALMAPVSDEARLEIERLVLRELGLEGERP